MPFPDLTVAEVQQAVPEATNLRYLARGGQKVVFACELNGHSCALKLLRPHPRPLADQEGDMGVHLVSLDDVTARARREVATMKQCDSPHLVRIGPIELRSAKIGNEELLCFSEELIDGETIIEMLRPDRTPALVVEIARLGQHVACAIDALWMHKKIHRDIKPGNIMRRRENGEFVLLDMGLVFDLNDESWSLGPVGTLVYFSPEQMEFTNRRQVLDFRSDMFSLGVTMYQVATGRHPFVMGAQNSWDVINNIKHKRPPSPREVRPDLPESISEIIMRLLGKRPALRYRRISMLQAELAAALDSERS